MSRWSLFFSRVSRLSACAACSATQGTPAVLPGGHQSGPSSAASPTDQYNSIAYLAGAAPPAERPPAWHLCLLCGRSAMMARAPPWPSQVHPAAGSGRQYCRQHAQPCCRCELVRRPARCGTQPAATAAPPAACSPSCPAAPAAPLTAARCSPHAAGGPLMHGRLQPPPLPRRAAPLRLCDTRRAGAGGGAAVGRGPASQAAMAAQFKYLHEADGEGGQHTWRGRS